MTEQQDSEQSDKPKVELLEVTVQSPDSQAYLPYYLGVTVFIGAIFALGVLVGHYFQNTLSLLQEYFYCLANSLLPLAITAWFVFVGLPCFHLLYRDARAKFGR